MHYNPNIHHRKSLRLKGYDYSQSGAYFVTICTKNRECLFGEIKNGRMFLNKFGLITQTEWKKTGIIRRNIILDEFVVMPNHIHGIIIINDVMDGRGTMHRAPTLERFGKPTSNTIPTIIRGIKSSVTTQINKHRNVELQPVWQRNYYEHIIRNENDLYSIREYIVTNPKNWKKDKLFV